MAKTAMLKKAAAMKRLAQSTYDREEKRENRKTKLLCLLKKKRYFILWSVIVFCTRAIKDNSTFTSFEHEINLQLLNYDRLLSSVFKT